MKKLSIGFGTLTLLGVATLCAGQDPAPPTSIQPAPVKGSSGVAPAPVNGSSRAPRAAGKRAAGAPLNRAGAVMPQLPLIVNGRRSVVAPPTKEEVARAEAEVAEAFRYKGTTAVPDRSLNSPDAQAKSVCAMLSKADFIPESRVQRFSVLDRRLTVVGWHLAVEKLEVRQNETLLRVRVAPLLRAHGEGIIGVATDYHEDYRIAGGNLQFLGSNPIPVDPIVMMGGQ
jgi:hypothetical protein